MTELPDVIQSYIQSNNENLFTNIPAIITDVSKLVSDNVVSVQPALKIVLSEGEPYDMPVIPDITVQWPSGGGALLSFPLAVDDEVLVAFSMRSITEWSSSTEGTVNPFDQRTHNMADAFVIPCIYRDQNNPSPNADDVVLKYKDGKIRINKDSSVHVTSEEEVYVQSAKDVLVNATRDVLMAARYIDLGDTDLEPMLMGDALAAWMAAFEANYAAHTHTGNMGAPTTPPLVAMDFTSVKTGGSSYSTKNRTQ